MGHRRFLPSSNSEECNEGPPPPPRPTDGHAPSSTSSTTGLVVILPQIKDVVVVVVVVVSSGCATGLHSCGASSSTEWGTVVVAVTVATAAVTPKERLSLLSQYGSSGVGGVSNPLPSPHSCENGHALRTAFVSSAPCRVFLVGPWWEVVVVVKAWARLCGSSLVVFFAFIVEKGECFSSFCGTSLVSCSSSSSTITCTGAPLSLAGNLLGVPRSRCRGYEDGGSGEDGGGAKEEGEA